MQENSCLSTSFEVIDCCSIKEKETQKNKGVEIQKKCGEERGWKRKQRKRAEGNGTK